jgi:hypothetical protein
MSMDFLRVDQKIPGQNYCCMSFVSPAEDTIEKKETFYFNKFLKSAAEKYKLNFNEIFADYMNFKRKYAELLQEDFNKLVNNKTNVRGIKVRGVFDTVEEASEMAKRLRENDKHFHVFVGQVGYWLPFDPDPDTIKDQKYLEEQLNDLVYNYEKNQVLAQQYFEDRKRDMIEKAMKEGRRIDPKEVEKGGIEVIDLRSDADRLAEVMDGNIHPSEIRN